MIIHPRSRAIWRACLRANKPPEICIARRVNIARSLATAATNNIRLDPAPRDSNAGPNVIRNQQWDLFFDNVAPSDLQRNLDSPYVQSSRTYPSRKVTQQFDAEIIKAARTQAGWESIWNYIEATPHLFTRTLARLRAMTLGFSQGQHMSTVRLVLPESWEMDADTDPLTFVDSITRMGSELRVSGSLQAGSSLFLRGSAEVLSRAADDMVAACPGIEVSELEQASYYDDNESIRIEASAEPHRNVVDRSRKETTPYWIDHRYEDIKRPAQWTEDSFETYITTLIRGNLRREAISNVYGPSPIDTDGIRVRLICKAFEDDSARHAITPSVLKEAIGFMSRRGGHRAAAEKLLKDVETWGITFNVDVYNAILKGYVLDHNPTQFSKFLLKMERKLIRPNVTTWLHFLELVQRDTERRLVIASMYELGLFRDRTTRRNIASITASHDAYSAFRSGKSVKTFMYEQSIRYGKDWHTVEALNAIAVEYIRFRDYNTRKTRTLSGLEQLLKGHSTDGYPIDITTINTIIDSCGSTTDAKLKITTWALRHMHALGFEADTNTYLHILKRAREYELGPVISVIFFYGSLSGKLSGAPRKLFKNLISPHPKAWPRPWVRPSLPRPVADHLRQNPLQSRRRLVAQLEEQIAQTFSGFKPVWSLGHAISQAIRLHRWQMKTWAAGSPETRSLTIPLQSTSNANINEEAILDQSFRVDTMLQTSKGDIPEPVYDAEQLAEMSEDFDGDAAAAEQAIAVEAERSSYIFGEDTSTYSTKPSVRQPVNLH